jgi:Tfp pilus assembly protein PilF
MYRAPRSRIAEINRPVDRSPIVFAAAGAIVLMTAFACAMHDHKKGDTVVATTGQPTTTQPAVAGEVTDPGHAVPQNVSFEAAEWAYKARRYREAVELFDGYTQQHSKNAFGHYMLGLSAWKSGDLDRAIVSFERSLELDPRNVKTLLNLGRVLLDKGRPDDALVRVGAAIEIDSGLAESHRMMGRVQSARGQRDSAVTSYRVALSLDPSDSWSMNNLGLLLIEQGRYPEALPALARAVELRPDAPAFANNLGVALERTGHFTAATEAYRAALAVDSTYTKASRSLARVEGKSDDSTTTVVDVSALAAEFNQELQVARQTRLMAKAAVKPDSVRPPER